MTLLQKLIGRIFPPYKFKVQRQEWTVIVDSLINALPDDFGDLKEQRRRYATHRQWLKTIAER
jgi:hypothetical protein